MTHNPGQSLVPARPFADRLAPVVTNGGFRMDDCWVWGASVARAEDGRYHMFASRWSKIYPFFQGYTAASEIVHAVADTPVGPFAFHEVVLGPRDPAFWDGRMTHNPCLFRNTEGWWLFYCGVTYQQDITPEEMWELNRDPAGPNGRMPPWFDDMRSGVAFAETINGPWRRPEEPLADLAALWPDGSQRVVNLTAVATLEGQCRIYYRHSGLGLVTALADRPDGPYSFETLGIVSDHRKESYTEDPCAFRVGNHYEVLTKDSRGHYTGEQFALLHSLSIDGASLAPAPQPKACSRRILWDDGIVREQGNLERPFVLVEDGRPAYLYAAMSDGMHTPEHPAHYSAKNTWNMVIPLR
jgi:hypothetical protein